MALTKVTGQVIKNTTDVTVGVLTVTNTLAVGGTVSIGGTLTYEDVTNVDAVGLITARNGIVVGSGITLSKDGDGFFTGVTTATTFVGALTGTASGNTTISNNADNRVITGGSGNALNGESNVQIDSSGRLLLGTTTEGQSSADDLTIATSANTGITIRSGTSNTGNLYFSDGTSSTDEFQGFIEYDHSGSFLRFGTAATERIRITSGGDMGLGTNSPASSHDRVLTIAGTNSAELKLTGSNYGVTDTDGADVLFSYGGLYLINNESTGSIHFHTGSGVPERLRIDSSGRVMIGTTTEGFSGADNLTVADSGHCGITIRSGDDDDGQISFSDATSGDGEYAGQIIYDHTDNFMMFRVNGGSEKLRIASDGKIGIGENTPLAQLHIKPPSNISQLLLEQNNATDGYALFQDGPNGGHLKFMRHINGSETQTLLLRSDGGLCFGTDTATANALDDYEEGTWTPSWAAGGGSSGIANIANCEYVKIGELVHVRGEFALTGGNSNISTTDGWYITGLPFSNNDSSGSDGTWWTSNSWTAGTRCSGICMSYGSQIYFGTEYASGMTRVNNVRHFAVTYRTN